MAVTIDIKLLLIVLVLIALIVLIIYGIFVLRKLLVTLDHTNKVLEDTETITAIAASRSQDIDGIINDVAETVSNLSDSTSNKSFVTTVGTVASSVASLRGLLQGDDAETKAAKKDEKKSKRRS